MEKVIAAPTTSTPVMHNTPSPSVSAHPMDVGFSSMQNQISKSPRVIEFSHTYEKGKKQVFSPKSIKSVSTLDTIAEQREI